MKIPRYLRLLAKPRSLDFELAVHDMIATIRAPWKLLKDVQSRRNATGKMARDDPALHVLMSILLALSGLLWGIFTSDIRKTIKLIFRIVLVDYLLIGSMITSVGFVLSNLLLMRRDPNRFRPVEWSYLFDVHSNSFLPVLLDLYVLQLCLLPFLRNRNWFSLIFSNLLYLAAAIHYCAISLLGYSLVCDKDFIVQTFWVVLMIINVVLFVMLVLSKTCMTRAMMEWYFYKR